MSLLVRAALLGGLAYVVSRAVRNSQQSLESSRLQPQRLSRTDGNDAHEYEAELQSPQDQPSTSSALKSGDQVPTFTSFTNGLCYVSRPSCRDRNRSATASLATECPARLSSTNCQCRTARPVRHGAGVRSIDSTDRSFVHLGRFVARLSALLIGRLPRCEPSEASLLRDDDSRLPPWSD